MAFYLSYKSITLLFFFLQGIIFSFILLKKGVELEKKSSIWMSFFTFLCCLYISPWMFGYAGWYGIDGYREILFFLPLKHYFLLGPALYFYSKTLMNPSYEFSAKDRLHFIPALLYLIYALVIFITDVLILENFYFYADGRDKELKPIYQFIGATYLIFYVSLSIKIYFKYRSEIYNELSFADTVTYKWFKQFLIALVIILIARVVFLIFYPNWGDFGIKFWYYFIFSVLFYYIAINSLMNSLSQSIPFEFPDSKQPDNDKNPKLLEDLSEKKMELEKVMKDQSLYRIPTLSLQDMSRELNVSKEQISTIINQGFGMNFNDYINALRIEEIKNRLELGDSTRFTILGIALESGFNSKTTFNRAFKKYTGFTPIQYLKKLEGF